MIAAMSANRVIGREQGIPWHIPAEQRHFRESTWGHPVIMGRKTFDSLGKPLPGRRNIVISRRGPHAMAGCETSPSLEAALALCAGVDKVFIIGGEQLYAQALPVTDTIILTTIAREVEGDALFPAFEQDFQRISRTTFCEPEIYHIDVYHRKRQG